MTTVFKPEESPALRQRSGAYPLRFNGRVPRRIVLLETVHPEWSTSPNFPHQPRTIDPLAVAVKDSTYPAWTTEKGFVFAIVDEATPRLISLKPHQFEVVEWFGEEKENT